MTLNASEFMQKMENRMIFSNEDKATLKSYAEWGNKVAPEMADHFYAYLQRDEEMNAMISEPPERMERLHKTFIQWFGEMFTGMDEWGDDYAKNRWKIGLIHVKIGIGPQHVVPAMAIVVQEATKKLQADGEGDELKTALSKICMIDLAFIEQAYVEVSSNAVLRETGWTAGLFRRLVATGAEAM